MKIGMLYGLTLEPCDKLIYENLSQRENIEIEAVSVNDISNFPSCDIILNRIYASQANLDISVTKRALDFLEEQELKGVPCINNKSATLCDYYKHHAFEKMNGKVFTPDTMVLSKDQFSIEDVTQFLNKYEQCIIKRNTSGRCVCIKRVTKIKEIIQFIEDDNTYDDLYVLQSFEKNIIGNDIRVAVINGKVAFSYGRTMVPKDSKDSWIASVSNGSKIIKHEATEEEAQCAINATKAIGAYINEVDMIITEAGPLIIENNPTPNYGEWSISHGHIELFCDGVMDIIRSL